MNKFILKFLVMFLVIGFVPSFASAANIYLETGKDNISVGDTFIISAKIDSEKININSVEGDIVFEGNSENIIVNDFSLAKSVFSLWPRTPSLSKDGNTISFVGGIPGGFNLDKTILFNIIVEAKKEGTVKISPKDISMYANDGKGTKIPVVVKDLTLNISAKNENIPSSNEWISLISSDKKSPEKFAIVVGKEESLFDGKRFAFFTAVDNQSGISYYEVSEDGKQAIRSGSMYVLSNQDDKITPNLEVTAYDKAGNKTVSRYETPEYTIFGFSLNFFIIIFIILIVWVISKKIKKARRLKKIKHNAEENQ
jgi:hypothetical protein